jgi:hypothetical protein
MRNTLLRMISIRLVSAAVVSFAFTARATVISFEGLADQDLLTTQYQEDLGVVFAGAKTVQPSDQSQPGIVLTSGISLGESEFPPKSGENVVANQDFAITGTFSTPVESLGGYFTYTTPIHGFGDNVRKLLKLKAVEDFAGQTVRLLPISAA